MIWTRITPCIFVPNIQNISGLPSPKMRVHRKNCRSGSFFIRPMCLGLFLALACFRFFFFLPCPNLGHKLKFRVATIFILLLEAECSCLFSCYSCPCCSPKNFKYKYLFGDNLSWGSCFLQSFYWYFYCYGTQVFVFGTIVAQENIKFLKKLWVE